MGQNNTVTARKALYGRWRGLNTSEMLLFQGTEGTLFKIKPDCSLVPMLYNPCSCSVSQ